MSLPTPAVRAALVALVASAFVAGVGAWLHVEAVRTAGRDAARTALSDRATLVAAALEPAAVDEGALLVAFAPFARTRVGAPPPETALALVDAEGRLVATSRADLTRGLPWPTALRRTALAAEDPRPQAVSRQGTTLWVAARPLGPSGHHLAAVRPAYELPRPVLVSTLTVAASLWGLLAAVLLIGAYVAGPVAASRLVHLGERLAQPDAEPEVLVARAGRGLGPLAEAFGPVGRRLRQLGGAVTGARDHVGALYQVNPHYVLLCTMDGRIVEANPAFYAITGRDPEALRGSPVEALAETFPVEPLMELAERSLREGASIGGIEYAITDRDDGGRPVEVALRAFQQGETALVLFQATDMAVRRTLERRVAAFSDTLDLMVDQRVQQLAAGQQSLRRLLDAAGVVVASFDSGGATRRWSGAAQALSGRTAADVPHFATAAAALGLPDDDRTAFERWFWRPGTEPFVGLHSGRDGHPRRLIWRKVEADRAGRADHRTVVGVELPAGLFAEAGRPPLHARLADEALRGPAGDGATDDRVVGDGGFGRPQPAAGTR